MRLLQKYSRTSAVQLILVAILAAVSAWFIQVGLANDSFIFVFAGPMAFAGYYLYQKPKLCFWFLVYGAMLAGIAVSYIPGMYNVRWGINLLAILLGTYVVLHVFLHNTSVRYHHDSIFLLFTTFMSYAIIISIVANIPIKQLVISIKNYFQFYPLILFFLFYQNFYDFPVKLIRACFLIALIQPVLAVFQYLIIVPRIKGMTGITASSVLDAVNGSFGTSLQGGGTGMYTLFTCTVLCSLLVAYSKKRLGRAQFIVLSIYFIFPMFLNETKAAVLFLLVGSSIVIAVDRQIHFTKKFFLTLLAACMCTAMVWFTLQINGIYGDSADDVIEKTLSYNISDQGYGQYRLNRLTCITFWWSENRQDPFNLFFGHGLDSTVEGLNTQSLSTTGSVARRYPLFGTGLTTASQMLWETGLMGFVLFYLTFAAGFQQCCKLVRSRTLPLFEQFLALTTCSGLGMTLAFFFYNNSFRNSQPANLFMMLMLGITIWLKYRQKQLIAGYNT